MTSQQYSRPYKEYVWELFKQLFPQIERQFQYDDPYSGIKHIGNIEEYAALTCLDEKKLSRWKDIAEHTYTVKLGEKEAPTFKGYVRHRNKKYHAERELLARFKTQGQGRTFNPSMLPEASTMLFYTTNSPCKDCMPELAEFINHCKTCLYFALFFERYYLKDTTVVEKFLPHKQRAKESQMINGKEFTMVLINKND